MYLLLISVAEVIKQYCKLIYDICINQGINYVIHLKIVYM